MAIPWLTAVKIIPWSTVLTAAPVIVQGAKQLWEQARRKKAMDSTQSRSAEKTAAASEPLVQRVQILESRLVELTNEVMISSDLIKSLAEQNIQLVRAIEVLRIRIRVLFGLCVGLGMAGVLTEFF